MGIRIWYINKFFYSNEFNRRSFVLCVDSEYCSRKWGGCFLHKVSKERKHLDQEWMNEWISLLDMQWVSRIFCIKDKIFNWNVWDEWQFCSVNLWLKIYILRTERIEDSNRMFRFELVFANIIFHKNENLNHQMWICRSLNINSRK